MLEVLFSKPSEGIKVPGGQWKPPDVFSGNADFSVLLSGLAGDFPGMSGTNPDAAADPFTAETETGTEGTRTLLSPAGCDTPTVPGTGCSGSQTGSATRDIPGYTAETGKGFQRSETAAPVGKPGDPKPPELIWDGVQEVDTVSDATLELTVNVAANPSENSIPAGKIPCGATGKPVAATEGVPAAVVRGTVADAPVGPGKDSTVGLAVTPLRRTVSEADTTGRTFSQPEVSAADGRDKVVLTSIPQAPEAPADVKVVQAPEQAAKPVVEAPVQMPEQLQRTVQAADASVGDEATDPSPGRRNEETPAAVLLRTGRNSSHDRISVGSTLASSKPGASAGTKSTPASVQTSAPVQKTEQLPTTTVQAADAFAGDGTTEGRQKGEVPAGVSIQPDKGSTNDRGAFTATPGSPEEQVMRDGNLTQAAVQKVKDSQARAATPEAFRGHQDDAAQKVQKSLDLSPRPEAMRGIEHVFQPPRSDAAQGVPFTGTERVPIEGLSRQLAEEIARRVSTLTNDGRTVRIELHLDPPSLGSVAVRLALSGDEVKLHFFANDVATKSLLSDALPELRSDLSQMGLNIGEAHVSVGQGHTREHEPRSHWATGFAVPGGHSSDTGEAVPADGVNYLV
ncbi:MAG: flagellar hook-length control protein FliK [Bacillota bacterium]